MDTSVASAGNFTGQPVSDGAAATTLAVVSAMTGAKLLDAAMGTSVASSWGWNATLTRFAVMDTVIVVNTSVPLWSTGGAGWAVNWDTEASSMYEDFDFSGFARVGQRYYGVREDGIYLLGADTDDGTAIAGSVSVGAQRFKSDGIKRLVAAYADASSTDKLQLKVSYSDARGPQEYVYSAERANDFKRMQRFTVGRGIKANYMTFEVFNLDGSDFDLSSITVLTSDMVRRI